MLPIFVLAFAQFAITLTQAQLCDKRKIGGELLCCKGTNNSCWVRVPSSYESNLPAGLARVCYCDEYCLTTGDCCPDLNRVRDECGEAQDCVLSLWSPWSECSVQCGFGTMTRRRDILKEPKNGGRSCPVRLEKKGCFRQNCRDDMVLAQILPADFRRLGSSIYETILPKKKVLTASEKVRQSFRSHCVNFKLMSKHPYCKGTWAESLKLSKPMCVECQPATMNDSGFCRGEGIVGNFTSWMATDAKSCSGLWMRVGDKIPNCKCVDQKFQNFIFV
ncbi:somatomedin-B and thrombospondin type-1 domain-containing protein-like isoform X2 [Xenia sp. Carnegie-2017]|uniref:somatomedin-B and thrombospondin type-1 domain-containing protein-like isoform X2 n=1 Tax=Xenia sp. Carnegie-2017 TaxID=2897299 RepID=UPI001F04D9E7|nr:somatomedin-B and thrombospondin type-1 domain-containing protein-like isoform X2 [Xenia sp. Carnegie-2017]